MKRQRTHTLKRVLSDSLEQGAGEVMHKCMNCSATFLDPLDGIGAACLPPKEADPITEAVQSNLLFAQTKQPPLGTP